MRKNKFSYGLLSNLSECWVQELDNFEVLSLDGFMNWIVFELSI